MNYYYAQCTQNEIATFVEELTRSAVDIAQQQRYIDDVLDEANWLKLSGRLQDSDIVYVHSISTMSFDNNDLKKKLSLLIQKNIILMNIYGKKILMSQVIETIDFILGKGLTKQKERQQEGIKRALMKKKDGVGAYGRPRTELPKDFADNIRLIMAKQMSHETYRAKLNMKRSTYFKMVKELKDSWKSNT